MFLKPQDAVLLAKLLVGETHGSQADLAEDLGLGVGEVNRSLRRLATSGLVANASRLATVQVIRPAAREFFIHALKYAFPAAQGKVARGMPTAAAAAPLKQALMSSDEMPPVWPDAEGIVRGATLKPLYRSVPFAAKRDVALYEFLTLLDAIRSGGARERKLATEMLDQRIAAART